MREAGELGRGALRGAEEERRDGTEREEMGSVGKKSKKNSDTWVPWLVVGIEERYRCRCPDPMVRHQLVMMLCVPRPRWLMQEATQ